MTDARKSYCHPPRADLESSPSRALVVPHKAPSRDLDLVLRPNGPELFLPMLAPNAFHLVCIEGVYEYKPWWTWYAADAHYACNDRRGCFTEHYPRGGVYLCGKAAPKPRAEDREAHRYTYVLCVEEKPLKASVILISPDGRECAVRGKLMVSTRQATEAEAEIFAPEPKNPPVVRKSGIIIVDPEESAPTIAEPKQWVEKQIRRYQHSTNYTDEQFLRHLAASKTAELLATREAIHDEWERFHSDPQAIALLKELSPITYERAQAMPRALALAEELAIRPKEPTASAPEPRRKETHEEWRERQLRHRRNQATVALALAREKQDRIAELDTLGLDPDERDRRLAAIHEIYADPDPKEEAYHEKL